MDKSAAVENAQPSSTLLDLCLDVIEQHRLKSPDDALYAYEFADLLDIQRLKKASAAAVARSYDFLRSRVDTSLLIEILGQEMYDKLEESYFEHKRVSRYLKQQGSILDTEQTPHSEQDAATTEFFPYEALVAGKQWPKDIDPRKRESKLSDQDFEKYFKMSKSEFYKLEKFKQDRKKKELGLW